MPNNDDVLIDNGNLTYDSRSLLGTGMSCVYSGHFGIREVAVKVITPATISDDAKSDREYDSLVKLGQHPNIVTLWHYKKEKGHLYLALEKCHSDLHHELKNNPTKEDKLKWVKQVCQAVHFLHSKGFAHGDLKPSNVLLQKSSEGVLDVRLCDFGVVKRPGEHTSLLPTQTGTRAWQPKEIGYEVKHRDDLFFFGVDCFSLGCLVHVILSGHHPFSTLAAEDIVDAVVVDAIKTNQQILNVQSLTETQIDLVERLLQSNPAERMNIETCVRHPSLWSSEHWLRLTWSVREIVGENDRDALKQAAKTKVFRDISVCLGEPLTSSFHTTLVSDLAIPPGAPVGFTDTYKNGITSGGPGFRHRVWNDRGAPGYGLVILIRDLKIHHQQQIEIKHLSVAQVTNYLETLFPTFFFSLFKWFISVSPSDLVLFCPDFEDRRRRFLSEACNLVF